MKVKEESEKVGLKLNIQKTEIMASCPITNRWGNSVTSDRIYSFGIQNHCDGDCSHEIKRHLLLGRKAMTNLDNILKSRNFTLPTKIRLVKALVFPVVMYRCESWTIKTAEQQRIDAFKQWCWRRLLRVPWTTRRSNQSNPEGDQSWIFIGKFQLKLKLQYIGHVMRRTDSVEKTLKLGKLKVGGEGYDRGWDDWMVSPIQWTWVWVNPGCWWWTGKPDMLQSIGLQRVRHDLVTKLS